MRRHIGSDGESTIVLDEITMVTSSFRQMRNYEAVDAGCPLKASGTACDVPFVRWWPSSKCSVKFCQAGNNPRLAAQNRGTRSLLGKAIMGPIGFRSGRSYATRSSVLTQPNCLYATHQPPMASVLHPRVTPVLSIVARNEDRSSVK